MANYYQANFMLDLNRKKGFNSVKNLTDIYKTHNFNTDNLESAIKEVKIYSKNLNQSGNEKYILLNLFKLEKINLNQNIIENINSQKKTVEEIAKEISEIDFD